MQTSTVSLRADETTRKAILATLHNRIGPQKFNAWFKRGARLDLEDSHVRVSVPNTFVAHWIETHYQTDIAEAALEHTDKKRPVVVTIDPSLTEELNKRQLDSQADIVRRAAHGRARPRTAPRQPAVRHTLRDFVVGESNKLAYSAAVAISAKHKLPFNLLFVHGLCGVGKTHLLQGICNAFHGSGGNGRVASWRYVTGEQFTNEYIAALRQRKFSEFRKRYRKLDLLAIDDVHFLSAKRGIQGEFLHTFDAIYSQGSRIVMASDAHPKLVGDFNEQLVSRFISGMVVKIDLPDSTTRVEILRRRAAAMSLSIGQDVLEYIAMHIRGSVRELEGALIKLAAISALSGKPVDKAGAADALAEHLARTEGALTLGDIENAAAAFFGITPADIHSTRRTRTVTVARMVAMFLARRHTQMSFPEIGRAMGKNHSSVVLGVQRLERLLARKDDLVWFTPLGKKSMKAENVLELLNDQLR
ncbi:MAG: chromosomal replication initiator protein DnaA [Planctomycetota bacterium]|jgi:chromosomal replication initiator protein